jgi:hypothetical protein
MMRSDESRLIKRREWSRVCGKGNEWVRGTRDEGISECFNLSQQELFLVVELLVCTVPQSVTARAVHIGRLDSPSRSL